MKQLLFFSFFIVAAAFTSCGSDDEVEHFFDRKEYKVSKKVMEIPANGGTDSIQNLSHDVNPWIIMRVTITVDGEISESTLIGNTEYDGGWFNAQLSKDGRWLIVKVDNTMADKQYKISFWMGLHFIEKGPYAELTVKKKD
jgi:hypothetical protein